MERSYAYLLALIKYTEAIHHFNMAVYVLEQDLNSHRRKIGQPQHRNNPHEEMKERSRRVARVPKIFDYVSHMQ